MDINQLEYFKIIAETESLTRAAERLHISQPAMSNMLKKFEEELGVELFDRSANRIYLNETGKIALIHTNNILRNVEHMRSDLLSFARQNLSLAIGFCDPGVRWYSTPRFSLAHPEVSVTDELYDKEDIAERLLDRTYDIIIVPEKIQHPEIANMSYLRDGAFLSVPLDNRLVELESICVRDIPEQPVLFPLLGGHFLRQIEQIFARDNPKVQLVKNDYLATSHLIRTSNFLAFSSMLSREYRNDGTKRTLISVNDPELNITLQAAYLKSNKKKVQKFLDWAKDLRNKQITDKAELQSSRE